MKREDILKTLVNLSPPTDEYWVCSGAAMVLYGLRAETADVDLGCTARLADRLESDGFSCLRTGDGNRRFAVGEDVEIFENWRYGSVETVSGFPVVSLAGLREMKSALGREKDIRDIALIDTSRLSGAETRKSCAWCASDPLLRYYHDTEWGIKQLHDDKKQFEFLTLEAMQCGCPCIISKQSGCGEILDKVIKTDYWDIEAMADAMYAVCTNEGLFKYLQEEGLKEVDQITWEKVGERVVAAYKKVLGWE